MKQSFLESQFVKKNLHRLYL